MGFSQKHQKAKQDLVDRFLNDTKENSFQIAEFLTWLKPQKKDPFWDAFFGATDKEMAEQHRHDLVRKFVSGLRIVVAAHTIKKDATSVRISAQEYPAMISPVATRHLGAGYSTFDATDAGMQAELRRQGAQALRSWLARYGGAAAARGVDTAPILAIAEALLHEETEAAA